MHTRPTKEDYYLSVARDVALRSTCLRTLYGAVIVRGDRIVSTGYNGSRRGAPNCCDVGVCVRANVPSRTRYELCVAVHAEANAIISSPGRDSIEGGVIYIAGVSPSGADKTGFDLWPCAMCLRLLTQARIEGFWVRSPAGEPNYTPLSSAMVAAIADNRVPLID